MTHCHDCREALGSYVLGGLDEDDEALVREHLRTCPDCAPEHASLVPLPGLLALAGDVDHPVETLPPAFEEALLDRFARDRTLAPPGRAPAPAGARRRRRRWFALAGAGVATAVVAAVIVVLAGGDGGSGGGPGRAAPPATAGSYDVALRPAPGLTGVEAGARLRRLAGGTGVQLWISGLPAGAQAVYELRCDGDDRSWTAGTFRADADGGVNVRLTTAARVGEYHRLRVVRRAPAGRPVEIAAARLG